MMMMTTTTTTFLSGALGSFFSGLRCGRLASTSPWSALFFLLVFGQNLVLHESKRTSALSSAGGGGGYHHRNNNNNNNNNAHRGGGENKCRIFLSVIETYSMVSGLINQESSHMSSLDNGNMNCIGHFHI